MRGQLKGRSAVRHVGILLWWEFVHSIAMAILARPAEPRHVSFFCLQPPPRPSFLLESLPHRPEQSIAYIPYSRLDVSVPSQLGIESTQPDLHALRPLARRLRYALRRAEHTHNHDALYTPLPQRLDRSARRPARGDDRIEQDRETRDRVRALREVVVVLDGLQGGFLAEEAQMMHAGGVGEEGLHGVDHGEAGA